MPDTLTPSVAPPTPPRPAPPGGEICRRPTQLELARATIAVLRQEISDLKSVLAGERRLANRACDEANRAREQLAAVKRQLDEVVP